MEELEVATLSSKGQIVIPGSIRKDLNIEAGTKFLVLSDGDNILLKKLEMPDMEQFQALVLESRKLLRKSGVSKNDVGKIITDVRKKKSRR